jgi:predicted nicotinamide N-methyase
MANDTNGNPLVGMSFLEVGAGAGVPSWSAMHCGARVVCTDLSSTNRIRSMGECAERNYRMMEAAGNPLYADQTKVCPHDWGKPTENVLKALNKSGEERFDVIVAADCCYMPWLFAELLDSIDGLLSDIGICIICFALHDNTDDDDVWKIVDRAKEKGFVVEVLPSTQLTPPTSHMEAKQGLVHSVRLSRPHA